jgi:hypothetical protein
LWTANPILAKQQFSTPSPLFNVESLYYILISGKLCENPMSQPTLFGGAGDTKMVYN